MRSLSSFFTLAMQVNLFMISLVNVIHLLFYYLKQLLRLKDFIYPDYRLKYIHYFLLCFISLYLSFSNEVFEQNTLSYFL